MPDNEKNGYVNAAADIQIQSISPKVDNLPDSLSDVEAAKKSVNKLDGKQKMAKEDGNASDGELSEPEYLDEEVTGPMRYIAVVQNGIERFVMAHRRHLKWGAFILLLIAFHVYLVFALIRNFDRAETMMIFTCIAWGLTIYYCLLKRFLGDLFYTKAYRPGKDIFDKLWSFTLARMIFYCLVVGAIIAFIIVDTKNDRGRLMGLSAMAFFLAFMFLMSANSARINWRPVCWGYFIQFIFGLLILRWHWGSDKFSKLSHYIVVFLDYTYEGTTFVYGFLSDPPNICGMSAVFAFSSIQVVIYFGAIVALLYYYGIMQLLLKKMAWLMQITLGTTATESLNACACVFLGQSEAPLLIKPYIVKMTPSEIHAVMTSGFSCIAGSLFAAYISFGACSTYLLSSTVMSAPGSLACSKILYPETKKSQLVKIEDLDLPKGEESNALECISNGAVMAVELVMAILANLIVFLALLAFANNVISWLIGLLGYEGWNLEVILGYAFFPLAYLMGVTSSTEQTLRVAQLMGTKTILNEFIAYQKLGEMVSADPPLLTARSQMIATYALCGFSNISSIGIQLGILGGMAPSRKPLLSKLAVRALIAGCISCFWTASLAGVLVAEPVSCPQPNLSATCFNVTEYRDLLANTTATTPANVSSSSVSSMFLKTEL
uniref:Sodium/nucleoside cotransporter n=1 Tax=Parascaris univalens TaxID=6257 RepID=A0A915B599_PARUN